MKTSLDLSLSLLLQLKGQCFISLPQASQELGFTVPPTTALDMDTSQGQ